MLINLLANIILFFFVALAVPYGFKWYKLGPSLIHDLFKRIKGKKNKILIKDPEIEKFLKTLNYHHFYVVDSEAAYGMAHPLSNEIIISSKIWNTGDLNLIKYVLVHEIAHKRQWNTRIGVLFFIFWLFVFIYLYQKYHPGIPTVIILGLLIGEMVVNGQRKFEDLADRQAAKIIGSENVRKALDIIFKLNKSSFTKRPFLQSLFRVNRDYPGRLKNIGLGE